MTTGEMTDGEYAQEREHWEASARTIIECGNVLEWFVGSWRKIVAGEEQNATKPSLKVAPRLEIDSSSLEVQPDDLRHLIKHDHRLHLAVIDFQ